MTKKNELTEWDWVANGATSHRGEHETLLIENREQLEVIGYVTDAEADYSFDDFALVRFKRKYYLLRTSGCSCPSPTEEWYVYFGPCTLREMRKHLMDENKENGYGVTVRQHGEFLALCDEALKAD